VADADLLGEKSTVGWLIAGADLCKRKILLLVAAE